MPGTLNMHFLNGCFSWMSPNLYIKTGGFAQHPLKTGCSGFQVYVNTPYTEVSGLGMKKKNKATSFSLYSAIWMFPKNSGTPKSSILIGFSIINHPFWGTTIFGNTYLGPWNISLNLILHYWILQPPPKKIRLAVGWISLYFVTTFWLVKLGGG